MKFKKRFLFVLISTLIVLLRCTPNIPDAQAKLGETTIKGVEKYWEGEISEAELFAGVNAVNSTIGELSNAPGAAGDPSRNNRTITTRSQPITTNGSLLTSSEEPGGAEKENWWLSKRWDVFVVIPRTVAGGRHIIEFKGKKRMAGPARYGFHNGIKPIWFSTKDEAIHAAKSLKARNR